MATFGPIASAAPNVLFNPMEADRAAQGFQRNQLLMQNSRQDQQQQTFARDAEARIGMARELIALPEPQAAAEWGSYRQRLQSSGLGQGLPEAFPGMERLRAVAGADLTTFQRMQIEERRRSSEAIMGLIPGGAGSTPGGQPAAPMQATPASMSVPAAGDASLPRGLRNNNPLNIEAGNFTQGMPGFQGSDGRFARFETQDQGIAAADNLLQSYAGRGLNTPAGIIGRWAPSSDGNNVSAYAGRVAQALGIGPNDQINMQDPAQRRRLIEAMAEVENGRPMAARPAAAANPATAQQDAGGYTQTQIAVMRATAATNPGGLPALRMQIDAQNAAERERARDNARQDQRDTTRDRQTDEQNRRADDAMRRADDAARRQEDAAKRAAGRLTPAEVELRQETEDRVANLRSARGALDEAMRLSPQAYAGPAATIRGRAAATTGFDSATGSATTQFNSIMTEQALSQLRTIFGGNPTEGERKILVDMQASPSMSRAEREALIGRAQAAVRTREEAAQRRLTEVRRGGYSRTDPEYSPDAPATPEAAPSAAGAARVIEYDAQGRRVTR